MAISDRAGLREILGRVALAGLVVFVALQLVPYGWSHPNPPVTQDAPWPDAASEEIARTSCYDCHSNETDWPPYSYIAPVSWMVRSDVEGGRHELNFSEWDRDSGRADKAAREIAEGSMPPSSYTLLHPDAKLTPSEKQELVDALNAMDEG